MPSLSKNALSIILGPSTSGSDSTGACPATRLRLIPGNDACVGSWLTGARSGISASSSAVPAEVSSIVSVTIGPRDCTSEGARCTLTALTMVFFSASVTAVSVIPASANRRAKAPCNVL